MKEQTEKLLTESLGEILEFVKAGKDLATQQAPLIVEEIITYGQVNAGIGLAGILILPFVCYLAAKDAEHTNRGSSAIVAIFAGLSFVFSFLHTICFFKALIAPRLYVLDYIKGLL